MSNELTKDLNQLQSSVNGIAVMATELQQVGKPPIAQHLIDIVTDLQRQFSDEDYERGISLESPLMSPPSRGHQQVPESSRSSKESGLLQTIQAHRVKSRPVQGRIGRLVGLWAESCFLVHIPILSLLTCSHSHLNPTSLFTFPFESYFLVHIPI